MGYTPDPLFEEHAILFDGSDDIGGPVIKRDGVGDAEAYDVPSSRHLLTVICTCTSPRWPSLAYTLEHYPRPDRPPGPGDFEHIGALVHSAGFARVSAALLPMIQMVPRRVSSTANIEVRQLIRARVCRRDA